ncbi:hypothetical protein Mboo_1141 [Methanoregula boonei 6A8]|uniref:Uncharacterized protein n=1 Tax=Methanoregula boonei (strain DSM 21154 / JCM 14090 / 6A8) TaxID=456442 RepID=A7I7E8_METB6|nr:hypothetical protein Mboo_1141 [Methanoregula boonei 6A8]
MFPVRAGAPRSGYMENGFSRNVKKYGIADKAASVRQNPAKNRLPGFYQGRLCLRGSVGPKRFSLFGINAWCPGPEFFLVRRSGLGPTLPGPFLMTVCGGRPGQCLCRFASFCPPAIQIFSQTVNHGQLSFIIQYYDRKNVPTIKYKYL